MGRFSLSSIVFISLFIALTTSLETRCEDAVDLPILDGAETPAEGLAGTPQVAPTVESKPVPLKIGLTVHTTGHEKIVGEAMLHGATVATAQINATGGIHGVPLDLVVAQSSSDVRSVIKAFADLTGDGSVPAVISSAEDDPVVVKGFAEQAQVLLLSNSMRSDILRGVSYTLRIGKPIEPAHANLVELMKKQKIAKIAVLLGEQGWTAGAVDRLIDMAGSGSFEITSTKRFWLLEGKPNKAALRELENGAHQAVYVLSSGDERKQILAELKSLKNPPTLVTLFGCDDDRVSADIGEYSQPIYSVDVSSDSANSAYNAVAKAFKEKSAKAEELFDAMVGYDTVQMIAAAYKEGYGTGAAVRDFILGKERFSGAAGELVVTAERNSTRPVQGRVIKDGKCGPIS